MNRERIGMHGRRCSAVLQSSTLREGLTLVELLVSAAIVGLLAALLLPAIGAVRRSARKLECANNIRQSLLAMANHTAVFRTYPTAVTGDYGNWAIALFPYLEESNLQFDREFPPGHPRNATSARLCPRVFECGEREAWDSAFPGIPAGQLGLNSELAGRRVREGATRRQTMLIGELPGKSNAPWVVGPALNADDPGDPHAGGSNIGFTDGRVEWQAAEPPPARVDTPGGP